MCVCCGTWSVPGAFSACCAWHMCWPYVGLGAHLCIGYMYCGVLGAHLVQEGSGPCKVPNFSHLLWSYRTYRCFKQLLSLTISFNYLQFFEKQCLTMRDAETACSFVVFVL